MATLEKIRSRQKMLIAVIAIALLCFVIGDFLNNSSSLFNGSRTEVGKVVGNKLGYEEFQKEVAVMTNVFKISGQNQMSDSDIREAVWNTFVQNSVLGAETEEIGMSVTAAELKDNTIDNPHPMMRQIPLFYNQQNQFDKSILLSVLSVMDNEDQKELKDYWLFWEARIKDQILIDKYQTLAFNAMSAPKAEQAFMNKLVAEEADIVFACKPYRELADSLFVPSKSDLDKKYKEVMPRFKTQPYRVVKSIVFDVRPTAEDFAQVEEKVKDAEAYLKTVTEEELPFYVSQESDVDVPYNPFYQSENDVDFAFRSFAFSASKDSVAQTIRDGEYYKTAKVLSKVVTRPDSAKVSHLVVAGVSEASQALADSLMTEINKGADFAQMVAKHSADPSSRQNGGDWGWIKEGQFGLDTFDNVIFSSKVGKVSKIETPQAILLVKVNEFSAPVKKVRLAIIANKVLPSNDTYRNVYEKANNFIAVNNTEEKFVKAAEEEKYLVRELGPMFENQSDLYVVDNGRPIVRWAFENKLGTVCDKPFDAKNKYIVGYISEVVNDEYIPMNSRYVESQVKSEVIRDMKAAQLQNELANSDISAYGRIDTVHISYSSVNLPGYGSEPSVVSAALNAEANQLLAPIKGNNGFFAVKVLDKKVNEVSISNSVSGNVRSYVYRNMLGSMMQNAKVSDNRSRFY